MRLTSTLEQMISIFSTLSDVPNIRYFDPLQSRTSLSCRFAHALQHSIDRYKEIDPDWPYAATGRSGPLDAGAEGSGKQREYETTQLIVLDRSMDVCICLLHCLTYQAAVWDLMGVEEGAKVT